MKVRLTVSVDYEVLEIIKTLAEESDRSVSSYVNLLLRRAVVQKK